MGFVLWLQDKLHKINGEYVEVFSVVSLMTLDIIMQCAFSFKDDIQQRGLVPKRV